MSIYQDNGFENRREYLASLAEDFVLPFETVFNVAYMLGRSEDFDALVTTLEDMAYEKEKNNEEE